MSARSLSRLVLGLLLALPCVAQAEGKPVAELLAEADAAYAGRKDAASFDRSLELWQQVLQQEPANAEAAWKLARAAIWWGDHGPAKKKEARHKKGMDWAKLAVRSDPKSAEAHYWLAANMGSYGRAHGIMESLSLIKPMKAECEAALKLDPKYWRAHMLLGMLYREAPGWPLSIGDDEKAVVELEAAVALAPKIPRALYELGLGYEEAGQEAKAKGAYERAIAAPPEPGFELESAETKAAAKKRLAKLSK